MDDRWLRTLFEVKDIKERPPIQSEAKGQRIKNQSTTFYGQLQNANPKTSHHPNNRGADYDTSHRR